MSLIRGIVAIEGIDASGKATQAARLADYLDAQPVSSDGELLRGHTTDAVLRLSFPAYDTPTGKLIADRLKDGWIAVVQECADREAYQKRIAHTNALVLQSLMTVNRFELADAIERASGIQGRYVVLDRYWASGVAYGAADGLDPSYLESLHTRLPKAHHVLIDIPASESFKRRPKREDRYEADRDRLHRARVAYLALFERKGVSLSKTVGNEDVYDVPETFRASASGWVVVNGLGSPDEVQQRIRGALEI